MRKMRACHDREEACECNDVIPDWGLGELDDDGGLLGWTYKHIIIIIIIIIEALRRVHTSIYAQQSTSIS